MPSMLSWIVLGLLIGGIAARVLGKGAFGILGDLAVGLIGGFLGGFVYSTIIGVAVTSVSTTGLAISVFGAIILMWGYRTSIGARGQV